MNSLSAHYGPAWPLKNRIEERGHVSAPNFCAIDSSALLCYQAYVLMSGKDYPLLPSHPMTEVHRALMRSIAISSIIELNVV